MKPKDERVSFPVWNARPIPVSTPKMERLAPNLRIALIAGFVALCFALACRSAGAQATVERMDQIVRSYSDQQQFMGSVLVVQGDQTVFEKSYGDANLEWKVANDSSTKFRIGSMTKQFTAASILLLEERGNSAPMTS